MLALQQQAAGHVGIEAVEDALGGGRGANERACRE
jgi:hypothetical protein